MTYYFAYGSNMDQTQMKERCPNAEFVGVAVLQDYQLAFTIYAPHRGGGAADIVPSAGSHMYGLLYTLSAEDLALLDTFEGYPTHYNRMTVTVKNNESEDISAQVYVVVDKLPDMEKPTKAYMKLLINAASKYTFPVEYQDYLQTIKTVD